MASKRRSDFTCRWHLVRRGDDHLERAFVNLVSHEPRIEPTRVRIAKMLGETLAEVGRTGEENPSSATRPEQEFNETFKVHKVAHGSRSPRCGHDGVEARDGLRRPFERNAHWNGILRRGVAENPVRQHRGAERGIQDRNGWGTDQRQPLIVGECVHSS